MPWREMDTVSRRLEFVQLACLPGANIRELCRREQISPKTGYKWIARFEAANGDPASLEDHSRRPLHSQCTPKGLERQVIALRQQNPAWGGRKIARRLQDLNRGQIAPSTVTSILKRHGLLREHDSYLDAPTRFEHEEPNSLWQMDFKGTFETLQGSCYALTLLDDHSRFNLALVANARMGTEQVKPQLQRVFERYGMPSQINTDNGPPWGAPGAVGHGLSELSVWMIRLGIRATHSRPFHPQTNGKVERFHRTLEDEVLAGRLFTSHEQVQRAFDRWRPIYNLHRPHESLQMETPVRRYRPSPFRFPGQLPAIEYSSGDIVVQVTANGVTRFKGRKLMLSRALRGLPVAFRANALVDGRYDLYFCHQRIGGLDLNDRSVDS